MKNKPLLINTGLLLTVAALLFRVYLPLTEEVSSLQQELRQVEKQVETLKQLQGKPAESSKSARTKLYALPERQVSRLGLELEQLANDHHLQILSLAPGYSDSQELPKLHLTVTPYQVKVKAQEAVGFAEMMAALEKTFPELTVKSFRYEKEVGVLDLYLLTSSQEERFFAP